jgi:hypothetical protein
MAAPHATGVLALLRALRPDLSSQQLRDWLVETLSAKNVVANANSANAHLLQSLTGGTIPPSEPPPPPPPPPVTNPPAAPTNLQASVKARTNVKLAWSDKSSNETGFQIERQDASGVWAKLVSLGANSTSYMDNTTQKGQTFTYRVYAFNSAGASGMSNLATVNLVTTSRK